jgi:prepilin-type N-terminal cleavage/methylation domain-containing protein
MNFRKHKAFTLLEILVALSIVAIILSSAFILDFDYIFKKNAQNSKMELQSRVLLGIVEQTVNSQKAVVTIGLPKKCFGADIEIGSGGRVLSSGKITCNQRNYFVSNSGQVYEDK